MERTDRRDDRASRRSDDARADTLGRLLDAVTEAVFLLRPHTGQILQLNRAAVDMVGGERSAIVGTSFWSLVEAIRTDDASTADDPSRLPEPVLDGRLETRTVSLLLRRSADGPRPVEVVFKRVDAPGAPPSLVAIARDTRERLDAQARLRRLAEAEHTRAAELNAVIRTIGDGVVVCDREGRITLANPAGQDLFPDVVEASYGEILAQLHDPDAVAPKLGQRAGPVVLAARNDPDRWIEVATYPVAGTAGAPPAVGGETIVVLRDVTASRKREAVRETFLGVLSHELRTPVTTIYGGSKLLSREQSTLDEATRRAIFTDIADEAERLQRLVEDVVALNRFGEDGGELGQEPVLLQRIVPGVVRSEESRWPGVSFDDQRCRRGCRRSSPTPPTSSRRSATCSRTPPSTAARRRRSRSPSKRVRTRSSYGSSTTGPASTPMRPSVCSRSSIDPRGRRRPRPEPGSACSCAPASCERWVAGSGPVPGRPVVPNSGSRCGSCPTTERPTGRRYSQCRQRAIPKSRTASPPMAPRTK